MQQHYWPVAILKTDIGDIEAQICPSGDICVDYKFGNYIYVEDRFYEFSMDLSMYSWIPNKKRNPHFAGYSILPAWLNYFENNTNVMKSRKIVNEMSEKYHADQELIVKSLRKAMLDFFDTEEYNVLLKEAKKKEAVDNIESLKWQHEDCLKQADECLKVAEKLKVEYGV